MKKQRGQSTSNPIKFSIFDIRIIGIIAQIVFVLLTLLLFAWIVRNIGQNLGKLGENQFACDDGTSRFRCAFSFMSQSAQFRIDEQIIPYTPQDSYWRAMTVAALNTLRVSGWGILLTTFLGTFVGIMLLSKNWFIRTISRVYVELLRNTPLLVQLVFISIFFAVLLPVLKDAKPLFGLPIYASRRGIDLPTFIFMPNGDVLKTLFWVGAILGLLTWYFLSRRTRNTGKETYGWLIGFSIFALCGIMGWFSSGNNPSTQGFVVQDMPSVNSFDDLAPFIEDRLGMPLDDWEDALASNDLTAEELESAQLTICGFSGTKAVDNFVEQLESANIPYDITRTGRLNKATSDFNKGKCELFVADQANLEDELENRSIIMLDEPRGVLSFPRLEGLNFQGGATISATFGAILIGLVLNTGASVAEVVRAGIQSVSKGQTEAANALGLNGNQRLRLVVLPQALQVIIPPLISQYLNLAKNSTLAMIVAYPDWWSIIQTIINQSGRPIQPILLTMFVFLVLSLSISALLNWYNSRIVIKER